MVNIAQVDTDTEMHSNVSGNSSPIKQLYPKASALRMEVS
jgi:hypothetical protein